MIAPTMSEQKSALYSRITPFRMSTNVARVLETQPLSEPVRMRVPTLSSVAPQDAPPNDAGEAPTVLASSAVPPQRGAREILNGHAETPGSQPPSHEPNVRELFNQFCVDGVLTFEQLYALLEYVRTTFDCTPDSHNIPARPLSRTLLQTLWCEALLPNLNGIISFPRFRMFFDAYVPQRFTYYKLLHPLPDAHSANESSEKPRGTSRGGPASPIKNVTRVPPRISPLLHAFRQCCIKTFGSVEHAVEQLFPRPQPSTISTDHLREHMRLPKPLRAKCTHIARELQQLALKTMSAQSSSMHSRRHSTQMSDTSEEDSVILDRTDFVPLLECWHLNAHGATVPLATRVASARVCLKKIRDERLAYENSLTFAQQTFGKRCAPPHRVKHSPAVTVQQLKVDLIALEKRACLTFARYAPLIGDENLAELRSIAGTSRGMGNRSPQRAKNTAFTKDPVRDADVPIWFLKAHDLFETPADVLHSDTKMIALRSTWTMTHQLQHFQLRFLPSVSSRLGVSQTKFLGKVSNETEHAFFSTVVDLAMNSSSTFISALLAFLPDTCGRMRIPTRVGTVVKQKELLIVEHCADDFTSARCIELRVGDVPTTTRVENCTSVKMVNVVNPPTQLLQRLEMRWKNQQRMKRMHGGEDAHNVSKVQFIESCVGKMSVREIVDVALDLPFREKVVKAIVESLLHQTATLCSILLSSTEPQMWINSGLCIFVDVVKPSTHPILKLSEFGQSTLRIEHLHASGARHALPTEEDTHEEHGKTKMVWDCYVRSVLRLHFELCCVYCNRFCVEDVVQARVRIITMSGKVKAIGSGSLTNESGMMELRVKDTSAPVGLLSYSYSYGPKWKFTALQWSNPADNEMVRVEVTCHESQNPDATDQRITTKTTSFGRETFEKPVVEWLWGGNVKMDDLSEQHYTALSFPPSHRAHHDVMHQAFQKYLLRVQRVVKTQKRDHTRIPPAPRLGFRFAQTAARSRHHSMVAPSIGVRRMNAASAGHTTPLHSTDASQLTTTSGKNTTTPCDVVSSVNALRRRAAPHGSKNVSQEHSRDTARSASAVPSARGEKHAIISDRPGGTNHVVDATTSALLRRPEIDDDGPLSVAPLTAMGREGHFFEVMTKNEASTTTYVGKVTAPGSVEASFFRAIKALDIEGDDTFTALKTFLPRTWGVKKVDGHEGLEGKELIVMDYFKAGTDKTRFAHLNVGKTDEVRSNDSALAADESTTPMARYGYRLERMDHEPRVLDQLVMYAGQLQLTLMPPALKRVHFYSRLSASDVLAHLFDMRSVYQHGEHDVLQLVQMTLKKMFPLVTAVLSLSVPQAWANSSLGIGVSLGATPAVTLKLFDFAQSTLVFPGEWRKWEKYADYKNDTLQFWAQYTRGISRVYYDVCRFYNQRFCSPTWCAIVVRVMHADGKVKGRCTIPLPFVKTDFAVTVTSSTHMSAPVGLLHVKAYGDDDVVRLSFTSLRWKGVLKDPVRVVVSAYENASDVDSTMKHSGRMSTQSTSFGTTTFDTDTVEWLVRKNAEPKEALTGLPLDNKHFPSTEADEAFEVFMKALEHPS